MFTTIAWIQSIDPAAAFTEIDAALGETHVTNAGNTIDVPELTQVVALAAGVETTVESFVRLVAPSLRGMSLYSVEPFSEAGAAAVEPGSPPAVVDLRRNPLTLVRGEVATVEILSNPAAAQIQWLVAWLADGPIEPVAGRMFTIRATGATTLVSVQWTPVALTLVENLPRGRYQLVGMRARSASCIAARVVGIGWRWRPGVLGCDAQGDLDSPLFRNGGMGVFGEFEDTDLPQIDFLAAAGDTAEDVYLDLIQTRSGPA